METVVFKAGDTVIIPKTNKIIVLDNARDLKRANMGKFIVRHLTDAEKIEQNKFTHI